MGMNDEILADKFTDKRLLNLTPRKKGDPGLPGAGRPKGSRSRLPALPPIHVDNMPFKITKLKKKESAAEYWSKQSPKILNWMFKRLNMFIAYTENGISDPIGADIFKLLGKELVKDTRQIARKANERVSVNNMTEGAELKQYRKSLVKLRESFADDAEIISDDEQDGGIYTGEQDAELGLHNIDDEF